jgi:hypothetical protein
VDAKALALRLLGDLGAVAGRADYAVAGASAVA